MKDRALKSWVVAMALTFLSGVISFPSAFASSVPSLKIDLEVTVKVSQKGFADQRGKLFGAQNGLEIPKDAVV